MDSSKVQFASTWNINQILTQNEKSVSLSGATFPPPAVLLETFTSGLGSGVPKFHAFYKDGSRWYLGGGKVNFRITSNQLYAYSYTTGTYQVRYVIYTTPIGTL